VKSNKSMETDWSHTITYLIHLKSIWTLESLLLFQKNETRWILLPFLLVHLSLFTLRTLCFSSMGVLGVHSRVSSIHIISYHVYIYISIKKKPKNIVSKCPSVWLKTLNLALKGGSPWFHNSYPKTYPILTYNFQSTEMKNAFVPQFLYHWDLVNPFGESYPSLSARGEWRFLDHYITWKRYHLQNMGVKNVFVP